MKNVIFFTHAEKGSSGGGKCIYRYSKIINQIKKEMEDSSSSSSDEYSEEEKEFEKIRSEMYSHFKSV